MITTVSTAFERELIKLINERKSQLADNIVGGLAISSLEEYREHVGKIAALNEVLSMCDEAASTVNKMR